MIDPQDRPTDKEKGDSSAENPTKIRVGDSTYFRDAKEDKSDGTADLEEYLKQTAKDQNDLLAELDRSVGKSKPEKYVFIPLKKEPSSTSTNLPPLPMSEQTLGAALGMAVGDALVNPKRTGEHPVLTGAEPAQKADAPKLEAPKAEAPKIEAPKQEAPKQEAAPKQKEKAPEPEAVPEPMPEPEVPAPPDSQIAEPEPAPEPEAPAITEWEELEETEGTTPAAVPEPVAELASEAPAKEDHAPLQTTTNTARISRAFAKLMEISASKPPQPLLDEPDEESPGAEGDEGSQGEPRPPKIPKPVLKGSTTEYRLRAQHAESLSSDKTALRVQTMMSSLKDKLTKFKDAVVKHKLKIAAAAASVIVIGAIAAFVAMRLSDDHTQKGVKNFEGKDYHLALRQLNQALTFNPFNRTALSYRSRAYMKLKQIELALQDLDRLIWENPSDLEAINRRGWIYQQLGQFEKAIKDYDQLTKTKEYSSVAYLFGNRAIAESQLTRYKDAIGDYSAAIRLNPGDTGAYLGRAYCHTQLKNLPEALRDYTRAIEATPKDANLYTTRAQCHRQMGDYDKALKDVTHAISISPQRADLYFQRGQLYSEKNAQDKAISDFNTCTQMNGANTSYWLALSDALMDADRLEDAIKSDTRALSVVAEKDKPSLLWDRAHLHDQLKQHKEALADYDQSVRLNPNASQAYLGRGATYMHMRDFKAAIHDFNEAIRLSPKEPQCYLKRGKCFQKQGLYGDALTDFNEAIRLAPKTAPPLVARGLCLSAESKFTEAIHDFKTALTYDPNSASAREGLSVASASLHPQTDLHLCEPAPPSIQVTDMAILLETGYAESKKGNRQKALTYLTQAVRVDPNNSQARCYLAAELLNAGDPDSAADQFLALQKLGRLSDAEALTMARALLASGRNGEALKAFNDYLKKSPDDMQALYGLARTYASAGLPAKARSICVEAMKRTKSPEIYKQFAELLQTTQPSQAPTTTPEQEAPKFQLPPNIEG